MYAWKGRVCRRCSRARFSGEGRESDPLLWIMIGCVPVIVTGGALLGAMPLQVKECQCGWRAGGAISVMLIGASRRRRLQEEHLCGRLLLGDDMIALTSQGVLVRADQRGQSALLSGHFSLTPTTNCEPAPH